jgi:hypothetical protein
MSIQATDINSSGSIRHPDIAASTIRRRDAHPYRRDAQAKRRNSMEDDVMKLGFCTAALVATLATTPALAQTYGTDWRQYRQQYRIQRGVDQGQLTSREIYRLQRREASIAAQESRMRARNDGRLTPRNRWVLNQRLSRTSHAIWRARHNRHY